MKKIVILTAVLLLSLSFTGCGGNNKKDTKESINQSGDITDGAAEITDTPTVTEAPITTGEAPSPTVAEPQISDNLYPAGETMDHTIKFGYIDSTGTFVIEPAYDSATDFTDGAAVVSQGSIYQIINRKGEILFRTDGMINEFHNGLAAFSNNTPKDSNMGYVGTDGKIALEPVYRYAGDFDVNGNAIVTTDYNTYSVIDKNGTVINTLPKTDGYVDLSMYQDGYQIVSNPDTSMQGVNDYQGNVIFEPVYGEIRNLGNGLFGIRQPDESNYISVLEPMAVFNKEGLQLSGYDYYEINPYNGEYASASDDHYTYFIGKDGKPVAELPKFDGIGKLKLLGDVIQAELDNEISYYHKDGTLLWEPEHTSVLSGNISVEQKKLRPNRFTLIYYPELSGLADTAVQSSLNRQLKAIFERDPESILVENAIYVEDYFEVELNKDLLMVYKNGYDYPWHAAHGMPIREYYYFNIKTGKQYQLGDLFKEDSLYISRLNQNLDHQLEEGAKNQDSMITPDAFTGITADRDFILKEDGLVIFFQPYEIAAYAAGFPEFNIDYSEISDMIDTEGDLWNSFDHAAVTSTPASEVDLMEMMDSVIRVYEIAMVSAINYNSFSTVEGELFEGSSLYQSQKKLVNSLYSRGVWEQYVDSKVEKVEETDVKGQYLVYVKEKITINYPDKGEVTKSYRYIYTVNEVPEKHQYQLSAIEKWNQ